MIVLQIIEFFRTQLKRLSPCSFHAVLLLPLQCAHEAAGFQSGQIYLGSDAFIEKMQAMIDRQPNVTEMPRAQRRALTGATRLCQNACHDLLEGHARKICQNLRAADNANKPSQRGLITCAPNSLNVRSMLSSR